KILDATIFLIIVLLMAGSSAYFVLWYRAFLHHDYYLINPLIGIVSVIVAGTYIADQQRKLFQNIFVALGFSVVTISIFHNKIIQTDRYFNPVHASVNTSYFTVEKSLRELGINRKDKVVSVPDLSPNITLYFLNQPGWTEAFNNDTYNMHYFVSQGAKYFITSDATYLDNPLYSIYLDSLIGRHEDILVYKIKNTN